MPLGMEVGLSPGDFGLDGDLTPPKREAEVGDRAPIFGQCLLWPNGWMHQDATWYGGRPRPTRGRPRPTRHCVRCGRSYPPEKGHTTPAKFWPMSIAA